MLCHLSSLPSLHVKRQIPCAPKFSLKKRPSNKTLPNTPSLTAQKTSHIM